jgi:hypothetical protein
MSKEIPATSAIEPVKYEAAPGEDVGDADVAGVRDLEAVLVPLLEV